MDARYITDETGKRHDVILDIEEYERLLSVGLSLTESGNFR